MAQYAPLVMTLATMASNAYSAYTMRKTAKANEEAGVEAQRIAEQNAANIEAETAETMRRQESANAQMESRAFALAAASGGSVEGSTGRYLESMSEENTAQLDWMRTAGASQAAITRREGALQKRVYGIQAGAAEAAMWGSLAKTGVAAGGAYASGLDKAGDWSLSTFNKNFVPVT